MDNVINLSEHRPHLQGEAKCLACGYIYRAVAPIGTSWMECPKCSLDKSTWTNPVIKDDDHVFCKCGSAVFHIAVKYQVYCATCGQHQGAWTPPEN